MFMSTKAWTHSVLVAATLCIAAPGFAEHKDRRGDNTGKNSGSTPTADQSKSNKSDVSLTAEIRRAIMKDDVLSVSAQNVKIIVESGKVTLKGPVKTAEEKTRVADKAIQIAGAVNVRNDLEVTP